MASAVEAGAEDVEGDEVAADEDGREGTTGVVLEEVGDAWESGST